MNKYQENQALFITLGVGALFLIWQYWPQRELTDAELKAAGDETFRVIPMDEVRELKDPKQRLFKARHLYEAQKFQEEEALTKLSVAMERGAFRGKRADYMKAHDEIKARLDPLKQLIKEAEALIGGTTTIVP